MSEQNAPKRASTKPSINDPAKLRPRVFRSTIGSSLQRNISVRPLSRRYFGRVVPLRFVLPRPETHVSKTNSTCKNSKNHSHISGKIEYLQLCGNVGLSRLSGFFIGDQISNNQVGIRALGDVAAMSAIIYVAEIGDFAVAPTGRISWPISGCAPKRTFDWRRYGPRRHAEREQPARSGPARRSRLDLSLAGARWRGDVGTQQDLAVCAQRDPTRASKADQPPSRSLRF